MKIDFHVHTKYSHDAVVTLEDIEAILSRSDRVVDAMAITDHNTVEGALELKKRFKDNIIIGEEVDTGEGELIGYWLSKGIEKGLGIDKTIEEIRRQGGKIAVPHPFDLFRKKRIRIKQLGNLLGRIDMFEAFNSKNFLNISDVRSKVFALENKILLTAGSDAHYKMDIGNAYVECTGLESVDRPERVCDAIQNGKIKGKRCSILYHVKARLQRDSA